MSRLLQIAFVVSVIGCALVLAYNSFRVVALIALDMVK